MRIICRTIPSTDNTEVFIEVHKDDDKTVILGTNKGTIYKYNVGGFMNYVTMDSKIELAREILRKDRFSITKNGKYIYVSEYAHGISYIHVISVDHSETMAIFVYSTISIVGLFVVASIVFGCFFYQTRIKLTKKVLAEKDFEDFYKHSEFPVGNSDIESGNKTHLIKIEDLEFMERISEGASGVVFRGRFKGTDVAIKKMKISMDDHDSETFQKEVFLMKSLRHPNVLAFIGICIGSNSSAEQSHHEFIITEFMENGSLDRYMKKLRRNISLEKKIEILMDICKGMIYLHYKGIIHRDLKLQNILMDKNGNAKIGDFGISRSVSTQTTMTGHIGTLEYISPEILQEVRYTEKCDVYSFAIIMYEILFECKAYEKNQDLNMFTLGLRVLRGMRPLIPFDVNNDGETEEFIKQHVMTDRTLDTDIVKEVLRDYLDLMKQCWSESDTDRPSFEVLLDNIDKLSKRMRQ